MRAGYVCNGLPELNLQNVYRTAAWIISELADGERLDTALRLLRYSFLAETLGILSAEKEHLDFETRTALALARIALEKDIDKKSLQYGYADSL